MCHSKEAAVFNYQSSYSGNLQYSNTNPDCFLFLRCVFWDGCTSGSYICFFRGLIKLHSTQKGTHFVPKLPGVLAS